MGILHHLLVVYAYDPRDFNRFPRLYKPSGDIISSKLAMASHKNIGQKVECSSAKCDRVILLTERHYNRYGKYCEVCSGEAGKPHVCLNCRLGTIRRLFCSVECEKKYRRKHYGSLDIMVDIPTSYYTKP